MGRQSTFGGGAKFVGEVVLILLFLGLLFVLVADDARGAERTAAEVYRAACATCHGTDGTGAPAALVGFVEPLPDFTDCSFATREPDVDWLAVTHEGGPERGFARMMPAFGDALSDDEVRLAVSHVRTFCPERAWPRGDLNLPRALVTEKAFPEDEAVLELGGAAEGDGAVDVTLVYEKRFGARNQLELKVPFGWQEAGTPAGDGDWNGGLGDIGIGWKRVLGASLERGRIWSVTGEVILPTGDEDEGLGSGVTKLEPFLSFGQILPADAFVHAQAGLELPVDSDRATEEAFWRVVLGKSFTDGRWGRTWSPMVEVLGARELVGGADIHWDLVPQVQVTLNTRQHVMANVGVRLPVDDPGSRDTQVLVYLLWDWFDGGLFEGW